MHNFSANYEKMVVYAAEFLHGVTERTGWSSPGSTTPSSGAIGGLYSSKKKVDSIFQHMTDVYGSGNGKGNIMLHATLWSMMLLVEVP